MSKKITIANPEVLSNGLRDPLRSYLNQWTMTNGQLEYTINDGNQEINILTKISAEGSTTTFPEVSLGPFLYGTVHDLPEETASGETPVSSQVSDLVASYRSLGTRAEKIKIRSIKWHRRIDQLYREGSPTVTSEDLTTINEFKALVDDLVGVGAPATRPRMFADFVTVASTAPMYEEILNSEYDNPSGQQGVSFDYIYFDKEYEEELAGVSQHYFIPNIYETTYNPDERESENLFKTPIVEKLRANLLDSTTSLSTQNQIVPTKNQEMFDQTSAYSSDFPMAATITVSAGIGSNILMSAGGRRGAGTEIADAFDKTAQGINFTRDLENVTPPSQAASVVNENITISTDFIDSTGDLNIDSDDIDNVKTVNLAVWADKDAPGWYGENPVPNNFSFIGAPTLSTGETLNGTAALTALQVSIFYDRLKQIADTYRRKFSEILMGRPAYSETLMYKVEKFVGPLESAATSDPIQSFHFMNIDDVMEYYTSDLNALRQRRINFVDTQIKYGQDYTYMVTAYQAIVGTHYRYLPDTLDFSSQVDAIDTNALNRELEAEVDVHLETVIKVVEIPLYMSSGKVLDLPPLPPEIDFKPIQGSSNKLRISLNMSLGLQDLAPTSLNSSEQAVYDQLSINQGRTDGLLTFGSDDAPIAFEVFKLNQPPAKIEDFNGSRIAIVPTLISDGKTSRQAGGATYIAAQPINQKCYYMFRSVDFHGGISNPSTVYEVELYGDSGVTFPIIRQYRFGQISSKMDTKSARKIIQILPRFTQAYLNQQASGLVDPATGEVKAAMTGDIFLGVENDPLFGRGDKPRKFKIRITSKTTGKKIDLNINFKTKEVRGQTQ